MEQKQCPHCDKVIEGYKDDHVELLLSQHMLKHFKLKNGRFVKKGGEECQK